MKTKLYFMELKDDRFIDYEKHLCLISSEKGDIIQKLKYDIDKKLSLFSDLFVRYLACTKLKLSNNELVFNKDSYGKPYLTNISNFHYNISHTRSALLIGVSEKPIGVDIEGIKELDLKIANSFFCKNELSYILLQKNQVHAFYEVWTKKEAYIKWIGKGLTLPLDAFDVTDAKFCKTLKSYKINEYMLASCSKELLNEDDLEVLNENQVDYFISKLFD